MGSSSSDSSKVCVQSTLHQHRYSNSRGDSGEIFLPRKNSYKAQTRCAQAPPHSQSQGKVSFGGVLQPS